MSSTKKESLKKAEAKTTKKDIVNKDIVNYDEYVLAPGGDVLVPMGVYITLHNMVQEVEKRHSNRMRTDVISYFHNKTHRKLSPSSKAKMKPEKLANDYYQNIDMEASLNNVRVDRDDLGMLAVQLMGEFRTVFRHNIDKGNGILRSELPQQEAPTSFEAPAPEEVADQENTSQEKA